MLPTHSNLKSLIGKNLSMDVQLTARPNIDEGIMHHSYGVIIEETSADEVALVRVNNVTEGLWVPYVETRAVIGYSRINRWLASGPFSGCTFAIGMDLTRNKVFAAHISQQSGSTGLEDYLEYKESNQLHEWYMNNISMPDHSRFSCSYIFVIYNESGITEMNQLSVNVNTMGGGDGIVTSVHQIK